MEINIFFAAIQSAFNAAVQAAVAEATKPLLERITALENNPAIGVDTTLEARVKALEERPAIAVDEAKMVEALNSQEWFWEKVRGFADAAAESALDDHCSNYDHDQYDEVYNEWGGQSPDEFVRDDDLSDRISDTVNDTLRNATFSISI